ncbi:MAG: hypothetical protein ACK4UN_19385 [Limisphaerales bacterium]
MFNQIIVKILLPIASSWAEKQERLIGRVGVPLPAEFVVVAKRIGIVHPERVRLLTVEKVPLPLPAFLRRVGEAKGWISPSIGGMTLRYGIFIRSDCWGDRHLLVHELVHTMQYERMGGFRSFLKLYLRECISPGYPNGPLEQEAKRLAHQIAGSRNA